MTMEKSECSANLSEERFLYSDGGIKISKLRFIVGGQTYAMSGITSVKSEPVPPNIRLPLLLIILGLVLMRSGFSPFEVLVVVVAGLMLLASRCGKYSVTLGTAGGEIRSFTSRNKTLIEGVVKALNEAIILRG